MCLNLAFVPLVWTVYPETARLTLEEMDYLFTSDNVSEKRHRKKWFRTEEVMRSLEREGLGGARERHRGSLSKAEDAVERGGVVFGGDMEKEKEMEGSELVEDTGRVVR